MIASAAQAWEVLQRAWVVVASDGNDTLGEALDVAGRAIPPERTVVVSTADRSGAAGALAPGGAHVLIEPRDRGSAATVLSPVHWIHAREADATVIVLTDGIVQRADVDPDAQGDLFGALVTAARLIDHHPEQLVVLGASAQGEASVSAERVDGALDRACGFVGRTRAFIAAGREGCAGLADRLARAAAFVGQEHERWALRQAYALAPSADFPEAVRAARQPLAVVPISSQGGREPGRHPLALARGTMRSLEALVGGPVAGPVPTGSGRTVGLTADPRRPPAAPSAGYRRRTDLSARRDAGRAPLLPASRAPGPSPPSRGTRR